MLEYFSGFFAARRRASDRIVCSHVSVCQSVTSWCFTETAKHRVTQTTPRHSPWTLAFWSVVEDLVKTRNWGGVAWGRFSGGAVAANRRISTRSVNNLVLSQVYHIERPSYLVAARSP